MASFRRLFIRPVLPTVLGNDELYALGDSDLLIQFPVETGFLFKGEISLSGLENALAKTLSSFPLFCGRLTRAADNAYSIKLVNAPVELEIVDTMDMSTFPQDAVIQDCWSFSSPLDMAAIRRCDDEPLFKMRLTTYTMPQGSKMSVIGITSAHMLGDGSFIVRFWRLLSQHYQGLPSLDPPITYTRAALNVTHLEARKRDELESLFPQLLLRNPKLPPPTERITLFFTNPQLVALQKALQQSCNKAAPTSFSGANSIKLSVQDCVTALVAVACSHAMAQTGDPPVTTIRNVLNLRGGGVVPTSEPLNALSWANATTSSPLDTTMTAVGIRRGFLDARDHAFQTACFLTVCRLWRRAADEGASVDFTPLPGELTLNSSWRFDYTSAHFGFGSDKAHFLHNVFKAPRYAKMFQRNPPIRLADDRAVESSRGAEFTFYLLPKHKPLFLQALETQWRLFNLEGSIEVFDGHLENTENA